MSLRVSDRIFSIHLNWEMRKRFLKELWDRPCPEQGQEWKRRVQNRSKIACSFFPFTERENMKTNSTCSYEEVNRFCLENHRKLAAFHQNRYWNVITHWTNHLASDQPAMYVKFSGSRTLRKIWAISLELFFFWSNHLGRNHLQVSNVVCTGQLFGAWQTDVSSSYSRTDLRSRNCRYPRRV